MRPCPERPSLQEESEADGGGQPVVQSVSSRVDVAGAGITPRPREAGLKRVLCELLSAPS